MKIIVRIIVILLAALLVVGATVAFAQSSLASRIGFFDGRGTGQGEGFRHSELMQRQRPARGQTDQNARGFAPRGDQHDGGINIAGIQPLLKNLAIITIVVAVIAGFRFVEKKVQRGKKLSLPGTAVSNDH